MNLFETLSQLKPITAASGNVPTYLMGAFRRKSISFYNGLTDENTIVYWFQSKSFTIDLRLKSTTDTPITERQAWVGYTHWDAQNASLSWELSSNYQNLPSGLSLQPYIALAIVFWSFHPVMRMLKTGVNKPVWVYF